MIVSERERDSFKSWGQECSSASQGHRYFMAFTFLRDKLMPRIERVALEKKKKKFNYRAFKPHPSISSLHHAHLHLALLRLCVNLGVTLSDAFLFTGQTQGTGVQAFVRYQQFLPICVL